MVMFPYSIRMQADGNSLICELGRVVDLFLMKSTRVKLGCNNINLTIIWKQKIVVT